MERQTLYFLNCKVAILVRDFTSLDVDKVPRSDENVVIQQSVLGVVLQTILDVYNLFYFYCIVIP